MQVIDNPAKLTMTHEARDGRVEVVADAGAYENAPGAVSLALEYVRCCVCETDAATPVSVGEDFEYRTSQDTFVMMRCEECGLVYLNPRPAASEFARIYPSNYHAFDFSPERYGFVYKVRRKLEARRALRWCEGLGEGARIIDVGCGDGFHLKLLKDFGLSGWRLEGVDSDPRAVTAAQRAGMTVHLGSVESLGLPQSSYDLALMIQTIEHVADPHGVLQSVGDLLRPGGRLVIVTDNTDSLDFTLFKGRYWGGYHFPRHWNLFNPRALATLAAKAGFEVESLSTAVSPVNWVYSVRNALVDSHAPSWLVNRFSLESTASLAAATMFDTLHNLAGRGALLRAVLRRPRSAD
jgi:SAM-dependent methyltransferase